MFAESQCSQDMKCSRLSSGAVLHLHCIFQLTLLLSPASDFIAGRAISPKDTGGGSRGISAKFSLMLKEETCLGRQPNFLSSLISRDNCAKTCSHTCPQRVRPVWHFKPCVRIPDQPVFHLGVEQNSTRARNQGNISAKLYSRVVRDSAELAVTLMKLMTEASCAHIWGNFSRNDVIVVNG